MGEKAKPNRPTANDGLENKLLGPEYLRLERAKLAAEMLVLIGEVREGRALSAQATAAGQVPPLRGSRDSGRAYRQVSEWRQTGQ
jgi:hypothetical protein